MPKPPKTKTTAKKPMAARREDYGAAVDGFFAQQPSHLRPVLDVLRRMVEEAAPEADSALKWGMPFYTIGKNTVCAIAAFRSHVNLILAGPPGTYVDPKGLLEGEGKTGRHLKVRFLDDFPRAQVAAWLKTAAERARGK